LIGGKTLTIKPDSEKVNAIAQSAIGTYSTSAVSTSTQVTSAQQLYKDPVSDSEREFRILNERFNKMSQNKNHS
jgi:hypothetical protein